ncbi:MAG: DNA polymerase III subunit gamma/tau [Nitrosomonadaceae bacterium]|nr:DNA polymerase III subunit gamma/tau [Nitrosomonadaceae bacterium]
MSLTQVLARKWRPKSFSELTGQDHVVKALTNALERKRLHHAYLFTGTRGVGKTTIARILAKALNCETGITSTPCGKCAACTEIDSGRFIDLIELDAASNTQVDNMRELLENALYAPTCARYKVYIIDEVHMLSKSAFNAMLKTLEEPPEHVKFVLATTDPQKIPVTVLSRCLQFNLKQIPPSLIAAHLKHVLEQEQISGDAMALQLLARAAQGSMRDALSMLDQAIAFGEGTVAETSVRAMLGAIDQGYLYDLLNALAQKDGVQMLALADAMEARSLSFDAALQDLAALLHRLALAQTVPQAISEDVPERERIFALAKIFTPEDIQLFYQIALHGRSDLSLAPDEYAGFTMTLMRMLAFMPGDAAAGGARKADTVTGTVSTKQPPVAIRQAPSATPQPATAPVVAVPSATSTAVAPGATATSFDGDWPALVNQLKLSGMTRMLAQNCEVKNFTADGIELCVPEPHRHLLEKAYQDKMKAALSEYYGKPVRLKFSVGSTTGMTPAELENREKQAKQSQAIAAIETDPFVRELVENFDAKLIVSSIKPIQ